MSANNTTSSTSTIRPGRPEQASVDGEVRDGRSFDTAFWSVAFEEDRDQASYVVRDFARGYIRTTLAEARTYFEDGFAVYDRPGHQVTEWANSIDPAQTAREPFDQQFEEIYDVEDQTTDFLENPETIEREAQAGQEREAGEEQQQEQR